MSADRASLKQLRVAGLVEGTTLIALIVVAVPLKHLFGISEATAIAGPIHGLAFLLYGVSLIETASAGALKRRDVLRAGLLGLVPFGTFANDAHLRRLLTRSGRECD